MPRQVLNLEIPIPSIGTGIFPSFFLDFFMVNVVCIPYMDGMGFDASPEDTA